MGIRTKNFEKSVLGNELLAHRSVASTFGELPQTPVAYTPVRCKERYVLEKFDSPFAASALGGAAVTPAGATGTINQLVTRFNAFTYIVLGAGQTLIVPTRAATGLLVSLDLTDNEGLEITHGIQANAEIKFTAGTDACFFRVKFTIADVSGTDDCAVGFRKLEAHQANIDDYDEMACLNVILGLIKIETILNNAATVTTDTTNTWADAATKTLQVNVSTARAVTYLIDGVAPSAVAAYTFDSAEVIIPFFYFLHATTAPGAVTLLEWETGLSSD